MTITGFVEGEPKPMGSHRAFVRGKRAVMVNDNKGTRPWQDSVRWAFRQAYSGEPHVGLVDVVLRFEFPRPKSHYGTGKNAALVKPTAPEAVTVKPDIDKLVRAALDCGTGILWRDDSQVASLRVAKYYRTVPGMAFEIYLGEFCGMLWSGGEVGPRHIQAKAIEAPLERMEG